MARSQKVVLKIGHVDILLPDDTGAAQVIKTLSKGIIVWNLHSRIQVRNEELELSMSYVPAKTKFTDEADAPLDDHLSTSSKSKGSKRGVALLKAPMLELMERRAD